MVMIERSPLDEPRDPMPASRWMILFVVWTIGLIVWAAYAAAGVYAFFRIF